MQRGANSVKNRLRQDHQGCRIKIGVPKCEHSRRQRVAMFGRADVTQLRQCVEAASNGRPWEPRLAADFGNREVCASIVEDVNHHEAPSQGSHKIRIAGETLELSTVVWLC